MRNLTANQYKISADIAGNIATVWFAGGVVSPILVGSENITRLISSVLIGLLMAIAFIAAALAFAKRIQND